MVSSKKWVQVTDEDNIYIDCDPVNTKGEVIDTDEDLSTVNPVLNDMSFKFSSGQLTDNVGFQTFLAITLFTIIYGIGDYVFKQMPKNMIRNKIESL